MSFFDLMIDCESAGMPPDGALLAIGAAFFDLRTKTIGPTYSATIHLGSATADGATLDPGTFMFWLGQPDKARNAVRFGGRHIHVVLDEFTAWIGETCRHEDVRAWMNSPSFDGALLGGAYRRAGRGVPWKWFHERDFRTVRAMYPQVEYDVKAKGEDAHLALDDAIFQIEHLFRIQDFIRNRNKEQT